MKKLMDRRTANWIFIAYVCLYGASNLIGFRDEKNLFKMITIMFMLGSTLSLVFLYNAIKRIKGTGRYFWFIIMMSMLVQFVIALFWNVSLLMFDTMVSMDFLIISYAVSLFIYFTAIIYKGYENKRKYQVSEIAYDSAIIITFAYTLGYIFLIKPLIGMGLPVVSTIALLGFPIMQIVLFIGLISLLLSSKPILPKRVLFINLLGIMLYIIGNGVFFYNFIKKIDPPIYTYIFWAIGPMLISLSGFYDEEVHIQKDNIKSSALYSIGRIISPHIVLVILFSIAAIKREDILATSVGYMIVILLITMRQAAIMLDNRSLMLQMEKLNNSLERTVWERTFELHKKSEDFEYEANHDPLTKLPNRRAFTRDFMEAISSAEERSCSLALLYLDLDSFKNINDLMGHSAGDVLLVSVAERLVRALEGKYSVYRLGGDEFSVIIRGTDEFEDINNVTSRIHKILKEEVIIKNTRVSVTSSIGIAIYPHNGTTLDSLMKSADVAMYYSKGRGRGNSEYFDSSMHELTFKKMNIGNELSTALFNNEFTLYYQPQFDAKKGRIYGVEALIRWNSPSLGIVSPSDFIPIAEESGLIIGIGEWTLREACKQAKLWEELYGAGLRVGVNVSPRQFLQDNFTGLIEKTLEETGLEPRLLDIEITENIAIHNEKYVNSKLGIIRDMGVSISMDDFGTGYSSLSYIKELPVDTMKIAMPFVKSIGVDERDTAIVDYIISMAKSLRIDVIAEGVESKEQLELLGELGCSNIQGYLIGKPLPPEEFERIFLSDYGISSNCAATAIE